MVRPEDAARDAIDAALIGSGWLVQDFASLNLDAGRGIAVREFPLGKGFGSADYLLYADGAAVGAIEAKKAGTTLTGVEVQTEKYAAGIPAHVPSHPVSSLREFNETTAAPLSGERSELMAAISSAAQSIAWRELPSGAVSGLLALDKDVLEFRFSPFATSPSAGLVIESHRGVRSECHQELDRIGRALGWTIVDLETWQVLGANVIEKPGDTK